MQPLSKMFIYFSFKINQDYIAKNLCENRTKPVLKCNGKCQLVKKLKEAEKEEQNQPSQIQKQKVELLYCHNFLHLKMCRNYSTEMQLTLFSHYAFQYSSSYHTEIFRPPKF